MRSVTVKIASFLASGALLASSSVGVAATPASQPVSQAQAPSPWLMLSAMSSTRSIALGGAAAAAQPSDVPPPPPPAYAAGPVIGGEVVGILVWFALIAIALGTSGESGRPNTPP
jgi:hypothetical protein